MIGIRWAERGDLVKSFESALQHPALLLRRKPHRVFMEIAMMPDLMTRRDDGADMVGIGFNRVAGNEKRCRDPFAVEQRKNVDRHELQRYLSRVKPPGRSRWHLGGARIADEFGAPPQRERGPEYVVVLVSRAYDGIPWLERVYQAGSLWTPLRWARTRTSTAYTPAEFERKRTTLLRAVKDAVDSGLDVLDEISTTTS